MSRQIDSPLLSIETPYLIPPARTMINVLFRKEYKKEYTSAVSTQVSNALLIGEIFGQVIIGLTCDYLGRKTAIVVTTALIVIGGILATAAHGVTILGMFWMITIARGIVGFGTGGEYPASSTSASEAANEHTLSQRGPIFILVTNLPLSFGGPLAVMVFLIVLSAAGENHLSTIWRVCYGLGCVLPLTVFYFRIKMLNSKLYRRGAIKRKVPYGLVLKYYWKDLIGTCGAWFLYDFVRVSSLILCSHLIISTLANTSPGNIPQRRLFRRNNLLRCAQLLPALHSRISTPPRLHCPPRGPARGLALQPARPQKHDDARLLRLLGFRTHHWNCLRQDFENRAAVYCILWVDVEFWKLGAGGYARPAVV